MWRKRASRDQPPGTTGTETSHGTEGTVYQIRESRRTVGVEDYHHKGQWPGRDWPVTTKRNLRLKKTPPTASKVVEEDSTEFERLNMLSNGDRMWSHPWVTTFFPFTWEQNRNLSPVYNNYEIAEETLDGILQIDNITPSVPGTVRQDRKGKIR